MPLGASDADQRLHDWALSRARVRSFEGEGWPCTGPSLSRSTEFKTARALVPGLKRIALVGDPIDRDNFSKTFMNELSATDLGVIDLTPFPMAELKKRVSNQRLAFCTVQDIALFAWTPETKNALIAALAREIDSTLCPAV